LDAAVRDGKQLTRHLLLWAVNKLCVERQRTQLVLTQLPRS